MDPCLENFGPKTHPYGRHIPVPSTCYVTPGVLSRKGAAPGGHNVEAWWHIKRQTVEENVSFRLILCPFRFRRTKRSHCAFCAHWFTPSNFGGCVTPSTYVLLFCQDLMQSVAYLIGRYNQSSTQRR